VDEGLRFAFTSDLFEWNSTATSWFFVHMPADQSAELREQMDGLTNGFGSIRVEVTVGEITWRTSVFPNSDTKQYMLPMKKQVRKANDLEPGDPVDVELRVLLAE
jgi:hypothetical protein